MLSSLPEVKVKNIQLENLDSELQKGLVYQVCWPSSSGRPATVYDICQLEEYQVCWLSSSWCARPLGERLYHCRGDRPLGESLCYCLSDRTLCDWLYYSQGEALVVDGLYSSRGDRPAVDGLSSSCRPAKGHDICQRRVYQVCWLSSSFGDRPLVDCLYSSRGERPLGTMVVLHWE